jgi:predicted dehydrogenase/threonine dehydrogenase-like Zn-dependent dehydrogenase
MKQVVQTLKDGAIRVIEVPEPMIGTGMVLVRNHFSLISPGTEGSTVRVARKSLIGKAKERPQQMRQVLDALRQQGPAQTYKIVMSKLDAYSPLGYSSAGEIVRVSPDVKGFAPGDCVACGGAGYANHAEYVAVPKNLCVKLRPGTDLQKAAYNTLGAVALQGVRQAGLGIGETCLVIGLGLVGQLSCLLLRAGGIKVIGVDIDARMAAIARENCADLVLARDEPSLEEKIDEFTRGAGVDAVVISAATDSTDPINLAGRVARKKGRVVIVGDVPTGFDREPYYRKELEVRMSCSYGPGRYDLNYEEKGIDYPIGHVRWTEKRNMEAFQELIGSGKIPVDYLTSHVFGLEDASKAYDVILKKDEPCLGVILRYQRERRETRTIVETGRRSPAGQVNLAFLGTGNYAQNYLLPNIPKIAGVSLKGAMDASGPVARKVAEKYGFEFCTSQETDIFDDQAINALYIASRHDSHGAYVIKALKSGKNVAVEKPLCLGEAELADIRENYEQSRRATPAPILLVGFNRRFAPLTGILKARLGEGPMAMLYRINAGRIPADSWIQDPDIGGGRIIGEVCHFVDYLTFLNGSLPISVYASAMPDGANLEDTVGINLCFRNGSIGTIVYFSTGSRSLFKEYVEVYSSGTAAVLRDFKELEIYAHGKPFKKKLISRDKGQKTMLRAFVEAVKEGGPPPIRFEEIYAVTLTTLKIIESLRTAAPVTISW